MAPNEWATFTAGFVTATMGLGVIIGFIYRRVIHPLNNVIMNELRSNGGESIKDKIDYTNRLVEVLVARFDNHMKKYHHE